MESGPIRTHQQIFSWSLEKRRWHTVHSIATEHDLPLAGMRRMGALLGYYPPDSDASNDRILVTVPQAEEMAARVASAITLAEVTRRLNIPRRHDELLMTAGYLQPFATAPGKRYLFEPADIDLFWRKLSARAGVKLSSDLVDIATAAKRAKCTAMEIVGLLLEGNLRRVEYDGVGGYQGLLIDPVEIAPLVRGQNLTGLNLRQVEQRLHTHSRVVRNLLDGGHLNFSTETNPINRCRQTVVSQHDLTKFMGKHASLYVLSAEHKMAIKVVKRKLSAAGISPSLPVDKVGACYYHRGPEIGAALKTT